MADTRACEQCGTSFVPRREHARFCSPSCRATWNRKHSGDLKTGASALQWSITAMNDTSKRLTRMSARDQARAFTVISELVWFITIVDATLVRHHLDAYDAALTGQAPAERQHVEGTLAGLRFVRNQIGDQADLAEFIQPDTVGTDPAGRRVTAWTWRPVPEPAVASLSPRGQSWEMNRYSAYQAELAGNPVGKTFTRATTFLKQAAADAPALTDPSVQTGR